MVREGHSGRKLERWLQKGVKINVAFRDREKKKKLTEAEFLG